MKNYRSPRSLLRNYQIKNRFQSVGSVLEVGGGSFGLAQALYGSYNEYVSIDFAEDIEKQYQLLPDYLKEKVSYYCVDFLKFPGDSLYDAIISCEVMEHIEDDRAFLEKLNRMLKPSGYIYLSVPAKMKFWDISDELFGHYRRYEKAQLHALLESTGFSSVEILSYGFPLNYLLQFLRRFYSKLFLQSRYSESKVSQSKKSGINQMGKFSWIVNILVNDVTMFPLNVISSVFASRDWSDGYVVIAKV
jgi:SAM-dependent methyltransferase